MNQIDDLLTRWTGAGLLDEAVAARIRAFETEREGPPHLRWPMRLAIAFGALLLGAGVLLFVASHWDALAPSQRFALVLALVAVFHVAGAAVAAGPAAVCNGNPASPATCGPGRHPQPRPVHSTKASSSSSCMGVPGARCNCFELAIHSWISSKDARALSSSTPMAMLPFGPAARERARLRSGPMRRHTPPTPKL